MGNGIGIQAWGSLQNLIRKNNVDTKLVNKQHSRKLNLRDYSLQHLSNLLKICLSKPTLKLDGMGYIIGYDVAANKFKDRYSSVFFVTIG